MSNPYDPNQGSGQQPQNPNPYGSSDPGQGYGSYGGGDGGSGGYGNYGGGSPYGANEPKGTDAVSITGFVLSLTCCLSVVGAILGFIGLGRTKNGQRKGRWAAISATIIGIIGTLAFAGVIVAIVFVAKNQITIDNAEVGQCMNVSEDGDEVSLTKKDCGDSHDAQIVYLGTFDEVEKSGVAPSNPDDLTDAGISALVCTKLLEGTDLLASINDTLGDDAEFGVANEDGSPSGDDKFICYVGKNDDKISEKIG